MNEYDIENDYQPDEANAHYVALHKLNKNDLERGDFACADYLIEYDREMGIHRDAPPNLLSAVLDALPTIRSAPEVAQNLVELYEASGLGVPVGLFDLPYHWAKALHEMIRETHWPSYPNCTIHEVFGWNHVFRFGGHLHVQFETPLPHQHSHWCEVGSLIRDLHMRLEPGPYTEPARLIEFI
ncbi:hypothetical protein QEH59_11755 [Coraliomargarita sp. SDUM461004]|uniref:Uncharacterized protein n=1 Tax=Thalassobacterium sedimentorum TaxID=3041258 RepID=A0ABU1AK23_9BACT|nr:hypothetical protein [Coraliomargarita sp. SDUM461004]MDQ8195104.1 hypothetical protein [Coraliomargarita sp. SDUM461004]